MQTAEMRETGGGLPVMLFSAKVLAQCRCVICDFADIFQKFARLRRPFVTAGAQAFSHSFLACLRISNLLQFLSR